MSYRVVHAILTPRYSGAEILVRDLCLDHIISIDKIQASIIALNPCEKTFLKEIDILKQNDIRCFYPKKKLSFISRIKLIRRCVKIIKPDLIFAHSEIPSLYIRIALFFKKNIKIISVLHAPNNYIDIKLKIFEKILTYRADAIIAVSKYQANEYCDAIRKHPMIKIIPNGIDLNKFEYNFEKRKNARSLMKVSGKIICLNVARVCHAKQQHVCIDFLSSLIAKNKNIELWFVGIIEDKKYYKKCLNKIERNNQRDSIKFLGPVTNIPKLFYASDLFLLPSIHEANPIALLEALASGLPIIALRIQGCLFAGKYDGVKLYDSFYNDEAKTCLKNFLEKRDIYKRQLEDISIKKTSKEYLNCIKEICEKK